MQMDTYFHWLLVRVFYVSFAAFLIVSVFANNADSQAPPVPGMQTPVPPTGPKTPLPECVQEAVKRLEKEGPYKSVELFSECAKKLPDSVPAHFLLGVVSFMAKQPEDAVKAFKEVLKLDPKNLEAKAALGKLYSFDKEKLDLAQEILEGILEVNPTNEDVRFDLGRVYALRGQVDKASREFSQVLSSERRFAMYHFEIGTILMAQGADKEARREFERALILQPGLPPAEEQLRALDRKAAGGATTPGAPQENKSKK
jgi:tetratricopeptide (TPR) repeat protein